MNHICLASSPRFAFENIRVSCYVLDSSVCACGSVRAPHPLLSPAQPPAVSALCTFGRALPPTNAHSSLVPPSAQDADGREVQEAVPNTQRARDRVLNASLEENGLCCQDHPDGLACLPQVSFRWAFELWCFLFQTCSLGIVFRVIHDSIDSRSGEWFYINRQFISF